MEEVPSYTPPAIPIQSNSWINAPQLPQSNDATPNQSTPQTKPQVTPTSQITQPVVPSNMQVPTSNTQSLPTERTTTTAISKSETPPLSTRTIVEPTRAPLVPVATQFQPQSQQPDTFLPSRITNVQTVVPSRQWKASPSSSAIAKPT